MQLGRLEIIDQSNVEHVEKISQVEHVDKKDTVIQDDQYKNHQNSTHSLKKNEVILDNVKFGFDNDTKTFFVRVTHNGVEYQYPTDQLMRLKTKIKNIT